jgi:PhnB protein
MTTVDPIAYRAVVPYLNVRNGWAAVRFYRDAFGAEEVVSLERQGGVLAHAELRIGEAVFMVREEYPEYGYLSPQTIGGAPVNLLVYVPDVRAFAERAAAHGAQVIRPVEMQFHGDLMTELKDPFGHSWFFATRVEPMTVEKTREKAAQAGL